jgi:hypothetical protein
MERMSDSNLLFQVEIAVTNVFTATERPKVFEPSIDSVFHFTDYAQAISSHAPTAHMRRATNWFYDVEPYLRLGAEAMPWYSEEVQESRIGRARVILVAVIFVAVAICGVLIWFSRPLQTT